MDQSIKLRGQLYWVIIHQTPKELIMTASFCSSCGAQTGSTDTSLSWTCSACATRHHKSPIPVAVGVVPIVQEDGAFVGLVGVVRKTENSNQILLPDGVLEIGEDAVSAAARTVFEHTGLLIDLDDTTAVETYPTTDGRHVLLAVEFPPIEWDLFNKAVEEFKSNAFATDVLVLDSTTPLEYDSHEAIVSKTCAHFFRPRKHKM